MKVIKLKHQSYCQGVTCALSQLNRALNDDKVQKPIYIVGHIIHNSFVTKYYQDNGVINITSNFKGNILGVKKGTFLISAHGIDLNIYKYIIESGLPYIDTTCVFVKEVHNKVKEKIKEGYTIIYIGNEGHPETEGVLSLDKRILLSTYQSPVPKTDNELIYVANQTTLSLLDIKEIVEKLRNTYPGLIFDNDICLESTKRQTAIMEQDGVDLCFVVGDKMSSNTNRLVEVAKKAGINTILIQSVDDIEDEMLKNIGVVSIASGASTPKKIIEEVITFLENY
ncbi:4-hydroxy-3-methylbut-2-enyl diphosphate reductase [Acholeplasma sp. OttesenSCG-928-E16]|nr:4-hydroxy-3-methylbut-2-enyl diphosphate reductase [Acholeplasma sp. OttesenSCG-928-E16]